jgi:hypothetical protein
MACVNDVKAVCRIIWNAPRHVMAMEEGKIPGRTKPPGVQQDLVVVRCMAWFAAAGLAVIGIAHLSLYLFADATIGASGIFLTVLVVGADLVISLPWIPFFGLAAVTSHWEAAIMTDLIIFGFIVGLIRARRRS